LYILPVSKKNLFISEKIKKNLGVKMKNIIFLYALFISVNSLAEEIRLLEFNRKSIDQHCIEYSPYISTVGVFDTIEECQAMKDSSEDYLKINGPEMVGSIILECEPDSNKSEDQILSEMTKRYSNEDNYPSYRPSFPVEHVLVKGKKVILGECAQ
jgi:hypothetical protein